MSGTTQLDRWAGDFGKEYTARNVDENYRPERLARMGEIFQEMLSHTTGVRRILEVGCNTGHNFFPLSELGDFELVGVEPQAAAVEVGKSRKAPASLVQGNAFEIPYDDGYFDLVYTTGVMMHIAPSDTLRALSEFRRVSRRYYFTMDYYEDVETVVPNYHAHDDLLWRRDMRKAVSLHVPNTSVLWESHIATDASIGKETWAFLFEFGDA